MLSLPRWHSARVNPSLDCSQIEAYAAATARASPYFSPGVPCRSLQCRSFTAPPMSSIGTLKVQCIPGGHHTIILSWRFH